MPSMGPEWSGSPQQLVGGLVVALVAVALGRRWIEQPWLLGLFALGLTALAEMLVELVEYPLLYSDDPHVSAYYDTLADLADTLVGAVVGVVLWLVSARRGRLPRRR